MGTLGDALKLVMVMAAYSEVTLVQYKPTGLHNWKWLDFMVSTGFCLNEAVLKQ